jgi:ABC-type transport system involved in multi-copper enzyme maturation permease subunit
MFGPHFHVDLVRLARKRWPTLVRVIYLSILLIGLTVMYRSADSLVKSNEFANANGSYLYILSAVADRAQVYAHFLVVLQDILVLLFLPVYVASAIAEEKENRTLEVLFLSFLTDRELVLGKLGARLFHLGAIVLAGLPLLVFMHLWGNVDIVYILYHEINTFLLLLTGGSICIWISTQSEGAFEAITRSYPWLALLGFVGIVVGFLLPWVIGRVDPMSKGGQTIPWYFTSLAFLLPIHLVISRVVLAQTIDLMSKVRLEETRRPRKISGAFALTEKPVPRAPRPVPRQERVPSGPGLTWQDPWGPAFPDKPRRRPRRKRHAAVSKIHPLAFPIHDSALFWKECLKDGTSWSLRSGWVGLGMIALLAPICIYRLISLIIPDFPRSPLGGMAHSFTYTAYFLCMAAYGLVVVFQTTLCVAGEREQDTLVFLQLIPEERGRILFFKWLGPLWRNWPILAIAYLGVLLGLGCGLYSPRTALVMCVFPWPFLLMLSFLSLCLSVCCRRVLFANMALAGFLLVLVVGHIVAVSHIGILFPYYAAILFEDQLRELQNFPWSRAFALACFQQSAFLTLASGCGLLAFWRFKVC